MPARTTRGPVTVQITSAMYAHAAARLTPSLTAGFRVYGGDHDRASSRLFGGLVAEEAVAHVFGCTTVRRNAGDGGVDLIVDGQALQVKWNDRPARFADFYTRPDLPIAFDLGLVVVPGRFDHVVELAWWLDRDRYDERRVLKRYHPDGNEVWAVEPADLWPAATLLDRIG